MSLNFNKYKKVATFMFLGLFVSTFSFLSVKDKVNKTYSLDSHFLLGEKVMADVPNTTPTDGLDSMGDGTGDSDGSGGDGADGA